MALDPGDYLTDGVNLFRFEGFLPKGEGAILEDARTERIWTMSLKDFARMKLNKVVQKAADAGD